MDFIWLLDAIQVVGYYLIAKCLYLQDCYIKENSASPRRKSNRGHLQVLPPSECQQGGTQK